jgi:hypothetical protein
VQAGGLLARDLHGYEQALLCGDHMSAWIWHATQHFRRDGAARCWWCRQRFDSFDDACRVMPLSARHCADADAWAADEQHAWTLAGDPRGTYGT